MDMNVLFNGLWNVSVQFAGIVLVILFVRKIFAVCHMPKKYAYVLWLIPFVRLLCPINIEGQISIWPEKMTEVQSQITGEMADYYQKHVQYSDMESAFLETGNHGIQKPKKTKAFKSEEKTQQGNESRNAVIEKKNIYDSSEKKGADLVSRRGNHLLKMFGNALVIVWLLGFFALFTWNFFRYIHLKKQVRICAPVEKDVYKADHIYTAFVLGVCRPRIYLPHHISKEQYSYVVAHERVHIKRKDYICKLIANLICYAYWWNPFAWISCYFMERDMEMSCDEAVLKKLGEEKKREYAEALLELTTAGSAAFGLSLCFAESEPKSRIKNIMKYRKPVFSVALAGVAVFCVLFVGLLTTHGMANRAEKNGGAQGNEAGTVEKTAGNNGMEDVPETFYGTYRKYDSYQRGDAVWNFTFQKNGILEVERQGTYRVYDEDGKRELFGMPAVAAEIKKKDEKQNIYELVWEEQGEEWTPQTVTYQWISGEDGFRLSGAEEEGQAFDGSYQCAEKHVDTTWRFFSDGTYVIKAKTPYTMNQMGEIALANELAFEMGPKKWSFLYHKDESGNEELTDGGEESQEDPYVKVENLLRDGIYHFMGQDGQERQNFYLNFSHEDTYDGTYHYYCGAGAGVRPDLKKGKDYDFYLQNTGHGEGSFSVKNGILILKERGGEERYFRIHGNELVFMETYGKLPSENSVVPFVFEEGATFAYTGDELQGFTYMDWRGMLFRVNHMLYYGSPETTLVGDSGVVEGKIRSSVEKGELPKLNGESNFGGVGDFLYTYDEGDGTVAVRMGDNEWHVFYAEKE